MKNFKFLSIVILMYVFGSSLTSCEKQAVLQPAADTIVEIDPVVKTILVPGSKIGKIAPEYKTQIGSFQVFNPNPQVGTQYSQTIYSFTVEINNSQCIDSIYYILGDQRGVVASNSELTFVFNQTLTNWSWSSPVSLWIWRDSANTNTGLVEFIPASLDSKIDGNNKTIPLDQQGSISFVIQ